MREEAFCAAVPVYADCAALRLTSGEKVRKKRFFSLSGLSEGNFFNQGMSNADSGGKRK